MRLFYLKFLLIDPIPKKPKISLLSLLDLFSGHFSCHLWWVDPGWLPGAHQSCSITPPPQLDSRRKYNKSLVGRDKGSLIKQKQRSRAKAKENKRFYSLLPISRRCSATSREAGFQYA